MGWWCEVMLRGFVLAFFRVELVRSSRAKSRDVQLVQASRLRSTRTGWGFHLAVLANALLLPATAHAADRQAARQAVVAGVKQLYAGKPQAARIEMLNALKADSDWGLAHALQGRIYLALGDGVAAESELRRALDLGVPEPQIQHLFLGAWLLQKDYDRVLNAPEVDGVSPVSRGYAARIRANAAMVRGDITRAAKNFDQAIMVAPNSAQLWTDIGNFRLLGGNVGGAIEAVVRAVNLNPHNIDAMMLMGKLVRDQYGLIAALPWFESIIERDPGNVPAMVQAAATFGEAGRARDMLAMTRRIQAIEPGNADARYLQAVLAARAGKPDLARALLYRIDEKMDAVPGVKLLKAVLDLSTGNSEQAIAQLDDIVKAQPENLKARRLLGTAMWRAGDPRLAITVLEPVAKREDADSYTLSVIGRAYEDIGDRATSATYLDRAALPVRGEPVPFDMTSDLARMAMVGSGNPDNADVAIPRITGMIRSGQIAQALRSAERLRDQNPGAPAAHVLVGDALIALGRNADGVKAYEMAANIRFSEPIVLRLIDAKRRSGDNAGAVRVLDLFLSQNPRNVSALLLASDHFMVARQWDVAISILDGLRERLGNRDATILNKLAWAWFGKGNNDRALTYANAAYAMAISNPALAATYGWILYKSAKNKPLGIALLKKSVAIAPNAPLLRFQLAQLMLESGDTVGAKTHLQAAIAMPDFAERKSAQDLLAGI
jgi:cellulose synthase operon protein C